MDLVFPREMPPDGPRESTQEERNAIIQERIKMYFAVLVFGTILRLPGLIALELFWRHKELSLEDIKKDILAREPFNTYFDESMILKFIHQRDLEQTAGLIMNYTVLVLSVLFLTLSLDKLLKLYSYFASIAMFAGAHHMSTEYVAQEQKSNDKEVKLDEFVKLERHGFHFLAQLALSIVQSALLGIGNDFARLGLCMFTLPIIARMCSVPVDKLILAHNVACSLAMLFICAYVLHRVPDWLQGLREVLVQLRDILVGNGLVQGSALIWRKLRLAQLLTFAWLFMFAIRLYVEFYTKMWIPYVSTIQSRPLKESGAALVNGLAETTNTPITLLSMGLTVSYVCTWIVDGALWTVGAPNTTERVIGGTMGITEVIVLLGLGLQTALGGMRDPARKTVFMGFVFFVAVAALLKRLVGAVRPQLQTLASSATAPRGRHLRCFVMAIGLVLAPLMLSFMMPLLLPVEFMSLLIALNSVDTCLEMMVATIQYVVCVLEARNTEPWGSSEDVMFWVTVGRTIADILVACGVAVFGVYEGCTGKWSFVTVMLLLGFTANIYKRGEHLREVFALRWAAMENINRLPTAPSEMIEERGDKCAICCAEMKSNQDPRMTPCKHIFHSSCLRRWLTVKQVCPLCYTEICFTDMSAPAEPEDDAVSTGTTTTQATDREADRARRGRDMWPLMMDAPYESDSDANPSYTPSEYTVGSTDDEIMDAVETSPM